MRCHCASVNSRRIKIAPLSRDLESHPRVGGNPLRKCQQDLAQTASFRRLQARLTSFRR
jgi:hypothetical protein